MGSKLVVKKVIIIGLFFLYAISVLGSTITLAAATPWPSVKESPSNGPIVISTGKFIGKVTPTITWSNPADIIYGTALSSTQLDATASVPGTFVYTPPIGTILDVGKHELKVSFTPTDTANYNKTSASVLINVVPAVPALGIVKSAAPRTYDSVGQTITYIYTITNNGNVDISAPITVTDDKFGTISIQSSGILSPGSSVTGTATYKITDADINTGSVSNLAYATGSFSGKRITSSNGVIEIVHYEHPTTDRDFESNYAGYRSTFVPIPMMYGSPIYGGELNGYANEPSITEAPNSDAKGHKAKVHLSKNKNKHKNHYKHHKTGKKSLRTKVDKK